MYPYRVQFSRKTFLTAMIQFILYFLVELKFQLCPRNDLSLGRVQHEGSAEIQLIQFTPEKSENAALFLR